MNPNKVIKGKRPSFSESSDVDYLMHMVIVLAQELSATRDRLDTLEQVSAQKGLFTPEDTESYEPSYEVLQQREAERQRFLASLFSIMSQEAAELNSGDTEQRFSKVIDDLAKEA